MAYLGQARKKLTIVPLGQDVAETAPEQAKLRKLPSPPHKPKAPQEPRSPFLPAGSGASASIQPRDEQST